MLRSVEVIELSGFCCANECHQRNGGDQYGKWQQNVDDGHGQLRTGDDSLAVSKVFELRAIPSTVNDARGIKTAAASALT
jgi:hypothetical protein